MLKIHEENWTAISKMTEAEREEHVRMINSQLPKTFVSKMRKTVNESVEKSLPQQPQQLQKLPKPV